jgi:hypothetical protein
MNSEINLNCLMQYLGRLTVEQVLDCLNEILTTWEALSIEVKAPMFTSSMSKQL